MHSLIGGTVDARNVMKQRCNGTGSTLICDCDKCGVHKDVKTQDISNLLVADSVSHVYHNLGNTCAAADSLVWFGHPLHQEGHQMIR